ncbi:nitroreductase/quinone reductase family protein [Nocardia sp. NPDC059240]|uniref:nitroreductase/quinone reductase family protein n=1 Tax=Nocardia sp. NPDC059240 TaxID=3346786 RepID=UPI0036B0AFA5
MLMSGSAPPPASRRQGFYRYVNPVIRFLVRLGIGVGGSDADLLRTLQVDGRVSGRTYEVPVRVAVIDGERYVMTMQGDTAWARNLRASGKARLLYRGRAEHVLAREIVGDEKTRFLTTLFHDPVFARRARAVLQSRSGEAPEELDENGIRLLGETWHPFQLSTSGA